MRVSDLSEICCVGGKQVRRGPDASWLCFFPLPDMVEK